MQLNALENRARPNFDIPATRKQVGLIAGALGKVFKGSDDTRLERLAVLSYLFNRPFSSAKCLALYEATALLDYWLSTPPAIREAEARACLREYRVSHGQEVMF